VTDDARAVTAVVLGGGPTGLAVLRELGRAGVPVLATADGDDLVTASRYFRPLPARVAAQDQDGIEASFRSLELERAVLFPCSDSPARPVSGFPSELQQRFPPAAADVPLGSRSTPELGGRSGSGPVAGSPCAVSPIETHSVSRWNRSQRMR
jgi:hypothetical protein